MDRRVPYGYETNVRISMYIEDGIRYKTIGARDPGIIGSVIGTVMYNRNSWASPLYSLSYYIEHIVQRCLNEQVYTLVQVKSIICNGWVRRTKQRS